MLNLQTLANLNNKSPVEALGTELHKTVNALKCVYDFSKLGGAIGTILLVDDSGNPAFLPAKALITRSFIDIVTGVTSGGAATIAAQAEAAADLLAATAYTSFASGQLDGKADSTAAHMVKTTVQRQVAIVVATAALTAGKFNLFLHYVLSD